MDVVPRMLLDSLASGFPHIPPECGASMAQAGMICLENQGHVCGVRITVIGSFTATFELYWENQVTEAMRRFWNDLAVATEHGAYGLAILLIRTLTGYTVIERSKKGTGFDWWLGNDDDLFQGKARMEVSGILRGNARDISKRLSTKKTQTQKSDETSLTAYVVVVEFGTPTSKVVQR